MPASITWKTATAWLKQAFAPVDADPEPPDHRAHWVLRDGVPDLCCDRHRLYPTDR